MCYTLGGSDINSTDLNVAVIPSLWRTPVSSSEKYENFLSKETGRVMRTSPCREEQTRYAVQQAEAGLGVPDVCNKYGFGESTFYRWRQKYGSTASVRLLVCLNDPQMGIA